MTNDWETMNFKQHHNEAYVISRLPKSTQGELNGMLAAIALTGGYNFYPEDAVVDGPEEFVFKWKNNEGSFQIAVTLSDDKHELVNFMFVGLLGPANGPQDTLRFDKSTGHSPDQIIKIAKEYA